MEALDLVAATVGGDAKVVRPAIIRHYLNEVGRTEGFAEMVKEASGKHLAVGKAEARISLKVAGPPPSACLVQRGGSRCCQQR